jgi:yeast amino acid transporter
LGCVLAFIFAGVIIIGVIKSLAKMVSVRPFSGALMNYPHTYVDEALGFAVGVTYWLAIHAMR